MFGAWLYFFRLPASSMHVMTTLCMPAVASLRSLPQLLPSVAAIQSRRGPYRSHLQAPCTPSVRHYSSAKAAHVWSMALLFPTSSLLYARYDNPLHASSRFLAFPAPTSSQGPVSLRIEARGIPRKESAKIRNRRMRRKFNGSPTKPRLSVFCSARQLYAMLVDDHNKKTLFYASTLQKSIHEDPPCSTIDAAQRVGEAIIQACTELHISEISTYDRNGLACGERMQAFEVAVARHGLLPR